jgi:CRISPR-associated protein Csm4
MDAVLLRCRPGSRFRLGERSLEETSDVIHSDTLFSALANVYASAFGAAEEWVAHVVEGRQRFSSAFCCLSADVPGGGPLPFIPRPEIDFRAGATDPELARRLKSIRFVSPGVFTSISRAYDGPGCSCSADLTSLPTVGGEFCFEPGELPFEGRSLEALAAAKVRYRATGPKVKVHAETATDTFYHQTDLFFEPVTVSGVRLRGDWVFFVKDALDAASRARFHAALRILADEGVGGDRSTGAGALASVEFGPAADLARGAFTGGDSQDRMSLSLVSPASATELSSARRYEVVARGGGDLGASGNPAEHRKRLRMMREGAVFSGDVNGAVVDVSPDAGAAAHRVLRNGLAFTIPLGGS